ncbi:MAG: hypothetical protein DWI04_04125 [Planctomycetota bacterium]|nr:MAG: hypothetical protein DWI04_04125 [Planctomycetota bacterium]
MDQLGKVRTRREFLGAAPVAFAAFHAVAGSSSVEEQFRDWIRPHVVKPDTLKMFLDPKAKVWARFDPTFGYLLRNSFVRDGVDGCHTLARYESTGQRMQVNFRDQPCRIHTYGDSFTQGHQVSDGETWQEVLAAHFCEPIRNFGIGGFGVYQAYRRLLMNEQSEMSAKNLIFNIWGDDHWRSVYAWRWLAFPQNVLDSMAGAMFHANPWVHGRLDDAGDLVDKPNLCPTEQSLEQLCDLDFIVETFRTDEIAQVLFAERTGTLADPTTFASTARRAGVDPGDLSSAAAIQKAANRVLQGYAVRVGMKVMERLKRFCSEQDKNLIVLLSYPAGAVWHGCARGSPDDPHHVDWHPQIFRQHLDQLGIPWIDSLPAHVAEFDSFKLSAQDYVDRYYIGHYNPTGNHFFAYAIKDRVRDWLSPPPPAYQHGDEPLIRFKEYLPG